MEKVVKPRFAIAAIFPAAMIPVVLLALQTAAISDLLKGVVVGVLIGASLLLLILARTPRRA